MNKSSNSFRTLCEVFQVIGDTRGSSNKNEIFAKYLAHLDDESLEVAVRFAGEGAFTNVSGRRCSVGGKTIADAICEYLKLDYQTVFKTCRTVLGSTSETIEKLLENVAEALDQADYKYYSCSEILDLFETLEQSKKREEKHKLLLRVFKELTPLEVKFFLRILTQGSLRIGFETKSIEQSIASQFGAKIEKVRYAHMLSGEIGKTAVLAKNNQLESAEFELYQPISFMLASPIESRKVESIESYIAEEKFDGMRAQIHASTQQVSIFSRDLNDISESFPDLCEKIGSKEIPETVLDGEIIVYKDHEIQPFQSLQKRMGVKKPSQKIIKEFPVMFVAYDILFQGGKPLVKLPLYQRRKVLEEMCEKFGIAVSIQNEVHSEDDIENLFNRAQQRGNEGLVLKRKDSVYEFGQRNKSWLKVKQPSGSLDTVIMYAHAGSGKRGGTYSDFTLGIRVDDDDRYEDSFIPIGKAYGGYTNEELKLLGQEIKKLTVDRFGPTASLLPKIVVELEFDDIQMNKRTKAKYTLRFPRFRAIRWDLSPKDCDTLKDVERMYQEKLDRKVIKQDGQTSFEIFSI